MDCYKIEIEYQMKSILSGIKDSFCDSHFLLILFYKIEYKSNYLLKFNSSFLIFFLNKEQEKLKLLISKFI